MVVPSAELQRVIAPASQQKVELASPAYAGLVEKFVRTYKQQTWSPLSLQIEISSSGLLQAHAQMTQIQMRRCSTTQSGNTNLLLLPAAPAPELSSVSSVDSFPFPR